VASAPPSSARASGSTYHKAEAYAPRSLFCDDEDTREERLGVPVLAGADGDLDLGAGLERAENISSSGSRLTPGSRWWSARTARRGRPQAPRRPRAVRGARCPRPRGSRRPPRRLVQGR
jgi:hypothetical protein